MKNSLINCTQGNYIFRGFSFNGSCYYVSNAVKIFDPKLNKLVPLSKGSSLITWSDAEQKCKTYSDESSLLVISGGEEEKNRVRDEILKLVDFAGSNKKNYFLGNKPIAKHDGDFECDVMSLYRNGTYKTELGNCVSGNDFICKYGWFLCFNLLLYRNFLLNLFNNYYI